MLFDKFCGLVERHIPGLRKYAESSRIFTFEKAPHTFLPIDYPEEDRNFINEQFFLPFRTVAVEDAAGLIVLYDMEDDMRGLNKPRIFVEVMPLCHKHDEAFDKRVDERLGITSEIIESIRLDMMATDPDMIAVHWGFIQCFLEPDGVTQTFGWVEEAWVLSPKRIYSYTTRKRVEGSFEWEMVRRSALSNAKVAIMEIALANLPRNFIVEITHVKASEKHQKKKKEAKIPRSQDRPTYILAPPKEIRRVMGLPEPDEETAKDGRSYTPPLERRAHPRTFRHERYTKMRGQTIIIPYKWFGPREAQVGNKRFKVLVNAEGVRSA